MKFDRDDMNDSARDNFIYCQDEGENPISELDGLYEMLKSIAFSLAVIADHLTGKQMNQEDDPDA